MADFAGDIQKFKRYGTYVYKFDESGNLTFDSGSSDFSRVYLAFPIRNHIYNNIKIQAFYDPNFVEFVPSTKVADSTMALENTQQQLDVLSQENADLKTQLDVLTVTANNNMTDAEKLATKQVILELRKALGQGRVDSDFSSDFPYAPVIKQASINSNSATQTP